MDIYFCVNDGMLWVDLYLYLTGLMEHACCNCYALLQNCEKQLLVSFYLSVRMGQFSVEKINTHFMFVYVFLKIVLFCETVWESVEPDRPHMIM